MDDITRFKHYSVGENSKLMLADVSPEFFPRISITLGQNCDLNIQGILVLNTGLEINMRDNCTLNLGPGQMMNGVVNLNMGEKSNLDIGSDCLWGETTIWTSDFHSILKKGTSMRINPPQDIKIANSVWIGHEVLILKGARVGENSVIAARSTVLKGVYPANVILAGSPAKVVKRNIQWTEQLI